MSLCSNKYSYPDEKLLQYLDVDLFIDEMIEMERHITTCDACQDRLKKLEPLSSRAKGNVAFDNLFQGDQKVSRQSVKNGVSLSLMISVTIVTLIIFYVLVNNTLNGTTEVKEDLILNKPDTIETNELDDLPNISSENGEEITIDPNEIGIDKRSEKDEVNTENVKLGNDGIATTNPKEEIDLTQIDKSQKNDTLDGSKSFSQELITDFEDSTLLVSEVLNEKFIDTLERPISVSEIQLIRESIDSDSLKIDNVGKITIVPILSDAPKPVLGFDNYNEYLEQNVKYPNDAYINELEGSVTVEFELAKDNTIKEIKVIEGFNSECNELVVDILKSGPVWETFISDSYIEYNKAKVKFSFIIIRP